MFKVIFSYKASSRQPVRPATREREKTRKADKQTNRHRERNTEKEKDRHREPFLIWNQA